MLLDKIQYSDGEIGHGEGTDQYCGGKMDRCDVTMQHSEGPVRHEKVTVLLGGSF